MSLTYRLFFPYKSGESKNIKIRYELAMRYNGKSIEITRIDVLIYYLYAIIPSALFRSVRFTTGARDKHDRHAPTKTVFSRQKHFVRLFITSPLFPTGSTFCIYKTNKKQCKKNSIHINVYETPKLGE